MNIENIKEKISKLVKPIEFIFIASFSGIEYILNRFGWVEVLILFGGYAFLNVTGLAIKPLHKVVSEIKKNKK